MFLADASIGKLNNFLLRICVIMILFGAVLFARAMPSQAATISVIPLGGSTVSVGQLFSVNVVVSSSGAESLNAVSGSLSYPSNNLQIVSTDKSGSIINFWISEPGFTASSAQFEGGVYNPGFSGSQGKVVTYVFKAKAKGSADITFSNATILANDGQGTSILERTNPTRLTIVDGTPEQLPESSMPAGIAIRSATHPDQSSWYNSGMVALAWDLPAGVTSVRTGVDHNRQSIPTTVSTPAISETTLTLEDGTWYFHLQAKDAKGWGTVTSYKINIDTASVEPPTFDSFPKNLTEGDVLLVSGSTKENAVVNMTLTGSNGDVFTQSAKAGSDGRFQAVWSKKLDNDSYTLSAEAVTGRGIKSRHSKDIVIEVRPTDIERIAKPVISYATIIALIAGVVVLCALWIWYLVQRARHFRKKVRANIKRANQSIHLEFKKLLDQARTKRKLTAEEEHMMSVIRESIKEVEEEIEEEVREIGQ